MKRVYYHTERESFVDWQEIKSEYADYYSNEFGTLREYMTWAKERYGLLIKPSRFFRVIINNVLDGEYETWELVNLVREYMISAEMNPSERDKFNLRVMQMMNCECQNRMK